MDVRQTLREQECVVASTGVFLCELIFDEKNTEGSHKATFSRLQFFRYQTKTMGKSVRAFL